MAMRWQNGFWVAVICQAILLLGTLSVWYFIRTAAYLAKPTDGDLYAHTWSFQAMVFVVYLVPAVALFVALIALELLVLSWFPGRRTNKHDNQPLVSKEP
jgi:hypothetical protein